MSADLSDAEREAFRRAFQPPFDDLGPGGVCTCDTYPIPVEDHGDECAVRALYEGWLAARDYYEGVYSGLGLRLNDAERDRERAEGSERLLREALERLVNASRAVMPYERKDCVTELIEAEDQAERALAASPGQPRAAVKRGPGDEDGPFDDEEHLLAVVTDPDAAIRNLSEAEQRVYLEAQESVVHAHRTPGELDHGHGRLFTWQGLHLIADELLARASYESHEGEERPDPTLESVLAAFDHDGLLTFLPHGPTKVHDA